MIRRVLPDERVLRFVGGEVAAQRRRVGLSQEEMAELCGMHRTSLGRIERGETDASIVLFSYLYFTLKCGGVEVELDGVAPLADIDSGARALSEAGRLAPASMLSLMGRQIRLRRTAMGLSLAESSALASVHLNTFWNLEKGLVAPSMTTYFRVLRALGVTKVTQAGGIPLFA